MDEFLINKELFDKYKEIVDNNELDESAVCELAGSTLYLLSSYYVYEDYHLFNEGLQILKKLYEYIVENYKEEKTEVKLQIVDFYSHIHMLEMLYEQTLEKFAIESAAKLVKTTLYAKKVLDHIYDKDRACFDGIMYSLDIAPEDCEFAISVLYDADIIFCPELNSEEDDEEVYMLTEYGEMVHYRLSH